MGSAKQRVRYRCSLRDVSPAVERHAIHLRWPCTVSDVVQHTTDWQDVELQSYMKDAAKSQFDDTMDSCMESATTSTAREACFSEAQTAIAAAMGKSSISKAELEEFKQKGAAEKMMNKMNACMSGTTTKASKNACRTSADVKAGLANAMGKLASEITAIDLQGAMVDAGKTAVKDAMKSCMEASADKAAKHLCKGSSGKEAMANAMGYDVSEVSLADVEKFVIGAAKSALSELMETCMDAAGTDAAPDAARKACRDTTAKGEIASALGKDLSEVSNEEASIFMRKAAKTQQQVKLKSCYSAATTDTEKAACKTAAKADFAESLGKVAGDISSAVVEEQMIEAAAAEVGDATIDCIDAATTDSEKDACTKDQTTRRGLTIESTAKGALKATTGKTTVTDEELQKFLRNGAAQKVEEEGEACMSLAGDDSTQIASCVTDVKATLTKALGQKTTVSTEKLEEFRVESARKKVREAMEGCIEAIDTSTTGAALDTARKACVTTYAKKAYKETMGEKSSDTDDIGAMGSVVEAVATGAVSLMGACVNAAADETAREACLSEARSTAKNILAVSSVSDQELLQLVDKAEGEQYSKVAQACIAAGSQTCDFEAAREEIHGKFADDKSLEGVKAGALSVADMRSLKTAKAKSKGAKATVKTAQRACRKALGSNTTKAALTTCVETQAKAVVTKLLGNTTAATKITTAIKAAMFEGDKEMVKTNIQACLRTKKDTDGKTLDLTACKTKAKAFLTAKGLDTDIDVESLPEEGAAECFKGIAECITKKFQKKTSTETQATIAQDCEAEAGVNALNMGNKAKDRPATGQLAAIQMVAEEIATCKDAGKDNAQLESGQTVTDQCAKYFAEQKFSEIYGAEGIKDNTETGQVDAEYKAWVDSEWTQAASQALSLANAIESGEQTKTFKLQAAAVEVEFSTNDTTSVTTADKEAFKTAVKTAISAADSKAVPGTCSWVPKGTVNTVQCDVSYSGTATEIEAYTTKFAETPITASTGRRNTVTSTGVYAGQTSNQCASTGCTASTAASTKGNLSWILAAALVALVSFLQ